MAKRPVKKKPKAYRVREDQMGWREVSADELRSMIGSIAAAAEGGIHPDYRDTVSLPPSPKSMYDEYPLAGNINHTAMRLADLRRKIDDFVQEVAGPRPMTDKANSAVGNVERSAPSTLIDCIMAANTYIGSDINRIEEAIDFLRSRL